MADQNGARVEFSDYVFEHNQKHVSYRVKEGSLHTHMIGITTVQNILNVNYILAVSLLFFRYSQ